MPTFRSPLQILGPLDVVASTGRVAIISRRQQVVLAMLLLEANHRVSVERLIDAVWEEAPPRTAREQIHICVSALRRRLGEAGMAGVITTVAHGYLLRAGPDQLDLHVFLTLDKAGRQAAEEGRIADAAARFGEGLSLWRGEPLAGVSSRTVQTAATWLAERRMSVVEEWIDARLRLGGHHQLVAELRQLVAAHPFRERLRGQLMLALHRSGRKAEALEEYRVARQAMIDELGLEPSAQFRRLEHAILIGDVGDVGDDCPPTHAVAAGNHGPIRTVPQSLPAEAFVFVGREKLTTQLHNMLVRNGDSGTGQDLLQVAAITGGAGVGKSALALRVATALRGSYPDGQLYAELRGSTTSPATPAEVLTRFVRAMGVPESAVPAGEPERADLYRSCVADRRILVVLDDVASEAQLGSLLPAAPGCAVLVSSRRRLAGLTGVRHLEVDVLDTGCGVDALAGNLGHDRVAAEWDSAVRLVQLCGGLPRALQVVAARLAARPHWTLARLAERLADPAHRLDELTYDGRSVRADLDFMYATLTAREKRLFRRLAVLDCADFTEWVAGALLDENTDCAAGVIEALAEARLLNATATPGDADRFFFHPLTRAFALERLVADETPEQTFGAVRRLLADPRSHRSDGHPPAERHHPLRQATARTAVALPLTPSDLDDLDELGRSLDDTHARYECALAAVRDVGNTLGRALAAGWPRWAAVQHPVTGNSDALCTTATDFA